MEPLRIIHQVTEKVAPGRSPAYSKAHVLKSLELIDSRAGIGRQQLSKELNLGEGTARTLVKRLKKERLVNISRGGMTLTAKGQNVLSELKKVIIAIKFPEAPITVGIHNYAVLVKSAGANIRKGIEQRDAALIAGAKGATTLVYDGKKLQMPGLETQIDSTLEDYIYENLKPFEDDVIIIGSDDLLFNAEMGAKSAALDLLEKTMITKA